MTTQKGVKLDTGKLRWDLLPIEQIEEVVKVLTFGANKYTENGWQEVENATNRYYSALLRHLVAWRKGEKYDKESGLQHLSHAATNVIFLLYMEVHNEQIKTNNNNR